MNRGQARKFALECSTPTTEIIYMETPHSESREMGKINWHVKCGDTFTINGITVRVKGHGPIDSLHQRALVGPAPADHDPNGVAPH